MNVQPKLVKTERRLFNRELSWLAFNRRVLEEATNPAHPLLERLRFLSISGTNLDEFFMVRVAGLKGHQLQAIEDLSADGMTATQQLDAIAAEADSLVVAQQAEWMLLREALAEQGLAVVGEADLNAGNARVAGRIFPRADPAGADPAGDRPVASVPVHSQWRLQPGVRPSARQGAEPVVELLMIPPTLPRFIRLPGDKLNFIAIETAIAAHFDQIFPGFEKVGAGAFRLIRDGDIEVQEEAEDLVRYFRSAIKRRRRGRVIRLEFAADTPPDLETMVREGLAADSALVAESAGLIGIADLGQLVDVDRPDLKFTPYSPRFPERILEHDGDCFAAIRAKDFIVHHPYESFEVVVAFLRQAAEDPGRRGDQADALPRRQAVGDHRRAGRRGRGRQVGHRGGRAESAGSTRSRICCGPAGWSAPGSR